MDFGINIEDKEFLDKLVVCAYLPLVDVDELFFIKQNMMKRRCNSSVLPLTIAPTRACNFRCIFYFEQGHYGSIMSHDTVDALPIFIENNLSGVKQLNIMWFGGEPLLVIPVIKKVSKKVIEVCKIKGIIYNSSIITNGYFYTLEIAKELKEYQVKKVQITLDGSKFTHDSRRKLLNGEGTYDVINNNLIATKGIIPVNLRINLDYDNQDELDSMIGFLKKINYLVLFFLIWDL